MQLHLVGCRLYYFQGYQRSLASSNAQPLCCTVTTQSSESTGNWVGHQTILPCHSYQPLSLKQTKVHTATAQIAVLIVQLYSPVGTHSDVHLSSVLRSHIYRKMKMCSPV